MTKPTQLHDGKRKRQVAKQVFARNLYRLLLDLGISQARAADRTGLTRDQISTYVTGKCLPSAPNMGALAGGLGTSVSALLAGTDMATEDDTETPSPALAIQAVGDRMRVRINQLVSPAKAMRIMAILNDEDE